MGNQAALFEDGSEQCTTSLEEAPFAPHVDESGCYDPDESGCYDDLYFNHLHNEGEL